MTPLAQARRAAALLIAQAAGLREPAQLSHLATVTLGEELDRFLWWGGCDPLWNADALELTGWLFTLGEKGG